jgi:peptidoglycan hydrolase-like protein with peptidoglycan-binding domain
VRIKPMILSLFAALLLLGAAGGAAGAPAKPASKPETSASKSKKKVATKKTAKRRRVRRRRVRRIRGQSKPSSDRIAQIQTALASAGTYHGKVDGILGKNTSQAVMDFQSSHGLKPTGKLDARTLQKLGLGSQVAGLGAPVPATSNDHSTTQQNP